MGCCTICMEEQAEDGFTCSTKACTYEMCSPCMILAFDDSSGENSVKCPLCKTPTARHMMESLCGQGSVRAVERELRPRVEFEVKMENLKKARGKGEMGEMKQRAQDLFHELSERLNMKCPRCSMVFDEYDGCNALTCGTGSCKAAFCAICLEDCGTNAHPHVRSNHGNLFDKEAFYSSKKARESTLVELFVDEIKEEPFEVKELVRINCERSFPEKSYGSGNSARDSAFVASARQGVRKALNNDRLSLLSDPQDAGQMVIRAADVSPRNAVPDDYRLRLHSTDGSAVCRITLEQLNERGIWKHIPLPDDSKQEKPESDNHGNRAKVDALLNIRRTLQCGVIAFSGMRHLYQSRTVSTTEKGKRLGDDEISVMFIAVSRNGEVVGEKETLSSIGCENKDVLGLNQNQRLTILDRHIHETDMSELLFDPLRHYIGSGTPQRVFRDISTPAPATFKELNQEQQRVAHPLALSTAVEVAGPPGTGKTKTITELVRSILECTECHVIVLSERNGAIDAIADKFADDCVERDSKGEVKRVTHLLLWTSLLSFGSSGSIGSSTKLFTLGEKLKCHPELLELKRILNDKLRDCTKLKTTMLKALSKAIEDKKEFLPEGAEPWQRCSLVESGFEAGLTRATEIVGTVADAHRAIQPLIEKALPGLSESEVDDVCLSHSSILGQLLPVRTDDMRKERSWTIIRKEIRLALVQIRTCLESLLKSAAFSLKNAETLELTARQADESLNAAAQRLEGELVSNARVLLSTIGSSHKLPVDGDDEEDGGGVLGAFGRLKISSSQMKKTIVVFDEAGCIPSYELLGLSRLGRSIDSLVCVGDKNQLPPYDPSSSRDYNKNRNAPRGANARQQSVTQKTSVKSLLDVSMLTTHTGKVKLTRQYRVPGDIASLLNARIYLGDYLTAPECRAPSRGFNFVDVPEDRRQGGKKYVNDAEVQHCLELVGQSKREGRTSIMVLTPYKKQQRELQFKFKRNGYEDVAILTIDQCQGQEADIVIISLVQKPTRFLNKNRLNVALSRVREKLYFLADRRQFLEASRSTNWDCSPLARDLLQLAGDIYD